MKPVMSELIGSQDKLTLLDVVIVCDFSSIFQGTLIIVEPSLYIAKGNQSGDHDGIKVMYWIDQSQRTIRRRPVFVNDMYNRLHIVLQITLLNKF